MKTTSFAVLLLIGDAQAKHHHKHHQAVDVNQAQKKQNDVANTHIDPWVYEKVYDNVNPQPYERDNQKAPKEGTYTPQGNPYWPNSKLMQVEPEHNRAQKKNDDISDKDVNPWVYSVVYDSVNPVPLERDGQKAPKAGTYTPYGNPYWPTQKLVQDDYTEQPYTYPRTLTPPKEGTYTP